MLASSPSPRLQPSSSSPASLTLFARPHYDSVGHSRLGQPIPSKSRPSPSPRAHPEPPASRTSSDSSAVVAAQSPSYALAESPRTEHSRPKRQMVDAATQYSPQGDVPSVQRPSEYTTGGGPAEPAPSSGFASERPSSPVSPRAPAIAPRTLDQLKSAGGASPASTPNTAKRSTSDVASLPQGTASAAEPNEAAEQFAKRPRPSQTAVKLMPLEYQYCNPKDLAVLIASMLMELIQNNDNIPLRDGHLTRFHSRAPPTISVLDYLQRLTTHATLSPPILLSMVSYIDRLCALYPAFTISSLTVHRFLITAATVASKGLSDSFWTNKTYARVGGVKLQELALLELEFLWRVEWKIVPRPEVLNDYYSRLIDRNDGYKIDITGHLESLEHPLAADDAQGPRDTMFGR